MIDVKKVEDFEKLTTALNGISEAIENMPTPSGVEVTGEASGTIATFNDGSANPLKSLVVDINPVQAGSGTPAPDNVRPISGWSSVEVTVADDTTDPTTEKTYEISLRQTVYGGKLNVTTGELTIDRAMVDLGTVNWVYASSAQIFGSNQFTPFVLTNGRLVCTQYEWNSTPNVGPSNMSDGQISASPYFNRRTVMVKDSRYTDATTFKTAVSGVMLCYELETPITATLTPTEVNSLLGNNNIWADTGDSNVIYIRDMNIAFNILWNAIIT